MSAIEDLLAAYVDVVRRPWDRSLAGPQRVWFCIYDPGQERRLRARFGDFEAATLQAGHPWVLVDLADAFATWMAANEYREAYFAQPDLMQYDLETFAASVVATIRDALAGPGVGEETVVAVVGLASLFGLTRVSAIIEQVNHAVPGRLVAFFPGSYDEASYFRLLDAQDGWDYLAVPIQARRA
jgi:hypothetical protein